MTRISPACTLSRRRCRRHEPRSRQPCPDSWLWIGVEIRFYQLCFCVFCFAFFFTRGCKRLRERQTALLAVVTYLSSAAFVSPRVVTKHDQLARSPCLWALCGIVKVFFSDWDKSRTIQPECGWAMVKKNKWAGSGVIVEGLSVLKFQTQTAVVSQGSEGFPGWRCPNGSVLIWIHRRPISASSLTRLLLCLSPTIMALAQAASLHVADIVWIYSDVQRDYILSELCIMSRFRPITPEDKGGLGRLFKRHVLAIITVTRGR